MNCQRGWGQVIRLIKSITVREVFRQVPEIKKGLWGGEFWTDGYYFATVNGRGDREVIDINLNGARNCTKVERH